MDTASFLIQLLNGIQYGFLLFLVASGLTLIFGIMGIINLAHGTFYMLGAYLTYWAWGLTQNFLIAISLALPLMIILGLIIERLAISYLYKRDHLYQVLLTYGLILILNEGQKILWGTDFHSIPTPDRLSGGMPIGDVQIYPFYRLFVSCVCLFIATILYLLIKHTRLGMIIRATANNQEITETIGINTRHVYTAVFSLGIGLAGFSGMIGAPLSSIYPGMGDHILIISFVVVVIGGIGSIRGAFFGAMLIGITDTFGKVLAPEISSMVIYMIMALVLVWRPNGIFGKAG